MASSAAGAARLVAVTDNLHSPSCRSLITCSSPTEYKNKILTKLAGGNPYYGCYGLALTIFSLGILRDQCVPSRQLGFLSPLPTAFIC